jgi:DNA-binding MarR family transcriptional regulator
MKKGKRDVHSSFVALDRSILFKCDSWKGLTPGAKLFYVYLRAKFNGGNNGQIKLHYSELKGIRGFSSNETISRSIRELEAAGWIERTRKGGLYRFQTDFKLTGKYDGRV